MSAARELSQSPFTIRSDTASARFRRVVSDGGDPGGPRFISDGAVTVRPGDPAVRLILAPSAQIRRTPAPVQQPPSRGLRAAPGVGVDDHVRR